MYQQYAQQGDASDEERELAEKNGSCSVSEDDLYVVGTEGSSKKRASKKRKQGEKVNLLVGSDEEEIF